MRVQFLEDAKTAPCINVSIQAEYGQPTMSGIQRALIKIDSSVIFGRSLSHPFRPIPSHTLYLSHHLPLEIEEYVP